MFIYHGINRDFYPSSINLHSHMTVSSWSQLFSCMIFASPDYKGSSTKLKFLNLVLVENTEKALPHLARLLAGINTPPDAGLLVVVSNRGGLGVVCHQTLVQGVDVVVGALDQRLASDVVLHVLIGRVEDLVVRPSRGGVDQTASNSCDQKGIVNLQLNGVLELLVALVKHVIQALSLGNGTRETVQDKTVCLNICGQ